MSPLDLRALFGALDEHRVGFVVIGGVAVGAHGYVRSTQDLDLTPDDDEANLERLTQALTALEATLPMADGRRFDPASDAERLRDGENMTLETPYGGLDIVQHGPGLPDLAALAADAVESDLLGISVRVCSLPHLRQMKEASGRAQDQADLESLPDLS